MAVILEELCKPLNIFPRRGLHKVPERSLDVALLLEVDRRYRERAEVGDLPRITPKRFNPDNEAWLSVLHTEREGWYFTALFSNTARAHQLSTTRDRVVIYFYDDPQQEGQLTVVTENHGPLVGRCVVRGSEQACRRYIAFSLLLT